jgi:hypothetical protein
VVTDRKLLSLSSGIRTPGWAMFKDGASKLEQVFITQSMSILLARTSHDLYTFVRVIQSKMAFAFIRNHHATSQCFWMMYRN